MRARSPVELVGAVRGLADQDETPVTYQLEQPVVVIAFARDQVAVLGDRRGGQNRTHEGIVMPTSRGSRCEGHYCPPQEIRPALSVWRSWQDATAERPACRSAGRSLATAVGGELRLLSVRSEHFGLASVPE